VQSNHCRQTAAAAARAGLECTLVLTLPAGQSDVTREEQSPSGNLQLDHLLGAQIIWAQRETRDETLQSVFQAAWSEGKRPYLIPYGGSNPTGAAAYAFAMQELLSQGVEPEWIVFPSSSGGTHAGLVLGARLFGYQGKVLGISVDEPHEVLASRVARLASDTADHLGENHLFESDDILVNADYLGGGYGVMGDGEREAIRLFARCEGILLDPVYTGRAAAGLIDLIRRGFFHGGDTLLFWHTGGAPALFADRYRREI
jgi:1-aminocyclopropane-1-carboxylate deaminase/D-cysteine desulfhydrase-like pyridoxal-dependent ACC family enzyme